MNLESDTIDAAQMEQEIEKEALEVTSTPVEGEEEDTTLADIEEGNDEDVSANNIKLMMDVFVNQLPTCVNREMIDKVDFFSFVYLFDRQSSCLGGSRFCYEFEFQTKSKTFNQSSLYSSTNIPSFTSILFSISCTIVSGHA